MWILISFKLADEFELMPQLRELLWRAKKITFVLEIQRSQDLKLNDVSSWMDVGYRFFYTSSSLFSKNKSHSDFTQQFF